MRLKLVDSSKASELGEVVANTCLSGTTVNTDEWCGYGRVGDRHDRIPVTADHSGSKGNDAVDVDGAGMREVRCNTMEGTGTSLQTSFGRSRG